ncbi:hypothetical protein BA190_26760 [Labrys sp. WJW]|uniref:LexA family protein n=1 Tax=Labrys sp. WJW TaxID=1737983 RepID=UPI00082B1840|nr:helix-turn-helix domain-containing protein [Labrys sp. WJW]OCC01816.1 hypothetical protein BA190_26760 [Labrys sp. WJW]
MQQTKRALSEQALFERQRVQAWIEGIERRFRVTRQEIAKRAGFSHSTIYRWFDSDRSDTPSALKVRQIADAFGIPAPTDVVEPPGFSEGEAVPYHGETVQAGRNDPNLSDWVIGSRALELHGYMPGDIVTIDQSITPRSGDVVIAQVYNLEAGNAETKVRYYEAPHLTTKTMDPTASDRPLYVDGERVAIMGVVTRSMRIRAA